MRRELLLHKRQYFILMCGLGALTLLFLGVWPDRLLQRLVIVSLSLFYMTWGITTHIHSETINKHVIYEYVGIGTLAGLLLFLVTI